MDNNLQTIIIDTNEKNDFKEGKTLYESRNNVFDNLRNEGDPLVSIYVYAYNKIEKTRRCIECILKYTIDINYELILIDNGSTDGTYEYFKSVPYKNKNIIKVTKNIGLLGPAETIYRIYRGKYLVSIGNDVCVTENWLANILKCFESDEKIGFVVPMSSNVSNFQAANISFNSFEEMQEKAKAFNKSNSLKWQERLRLITPIAIFKREVIDIVGKFDCAFFHEFGEDDMSLRVRRAGYKMILCGDTFVHHDHEPGKSDSRTSEEINSSLKRGRKMYFDKYHGIDAWDDVNNFEINLINMIHKQERMYNSNILGIDVRCGTPILEIKNRLRTEGISQCSVSSFTTNAKYYQDLLAISDNVYVDRIQYIHEYFNVNIFDYIILGEPINFYEKPIKLIQDILNMLKSGGNLLFKFRNVMDIYTLLANFGYEENSNKDLPVYITINDFCNCLRLMNVSDIKLSEEFYTFDENSEELIKDIVTSNKIVKDSNRVINGLKVKEYLLCITK